MALQAASSEAILANHQLQITAMKSVALAAAPAPAPAQQAFAQATMLPSITKQSNTATAKSVQLPSQQREKQRQPSRLAEANGTDDESDNGDHGGNDDRPSHHHPRHSPHEHDKRRSDSSEPSERKHRRHKSHRHDADDYGPARGRHNDHGHHRHREHEKEPHYNTDERGPGRRLIVSSICFCTHQV